jgi:thiosulfate/3-mercaptopyruvate sulfurtransferase
VLHPMRRDLPEKELLEARLSGAGIANDTTVILYDDFSNLWAAYSLWMLKIYGHADVRLLDGGRKKWLAEGRPTTIEAPTYPETAYRARKPDWTLRAHRDLVLEQLGKPDRVLVDLRPADMYRGDNLFGLPAGGHIPARSTSPPSWWSKGGSSRSGARQPRGTTERSARSMSSASSLPGRG